MWYQNKSNGLFYLLISLFSLISEKQVKFRKEMLTAHLPFTVKMQGIQSLWEDMVKKLGALIQISHFSYFVQHE